MNADRLDCSGTTTGLETEFCKNTELSELAALADVLGTMVGLDVRYSASSHDDDFRTQQRCTPSVIDINTVRCGSLGRSFIGFGLGYCFDDVHNVLLINSKQWGSQDGLVVFAPSAQAASTPIYVEMNHVFDAVRYRYRLVGNVVEVSSSARPAEGAEKYRFQNGCWRLIGEDRRWSDYMVEFNDDLEAISINHLTGQAILDFKEEKVSSENLRHKLCVWIGGSISMKSNTMMLTANDVAIIGLKGDYRLWVLLVGMGWQAAIRATRSI